MQCISLDRQKWHNKIPVERLAPATFWVWGRSTHRPHGVGACGLRTEVLQPGEFQGRARSRWSKAPRSQIHNLQLKNAPHPHRLPPSPAPTFNLYKSQDPLWQGRVGNAPTVLRKKTYESFCLSRRRNFDAASQSGTLHLHVAANCAVKVMAIKAIAAVFNVRKVCDVLWLCRKVSFSLCSISIHRLRFSSDLKDVYYFCFWTWERVRNG